MSSAKTILAAGSLSQGTPRLLGNFAGEFGELALGRQTTFGRAPENTVQINDREMSKLHFSIEQVGSSFLLRDLGSSNGTFVNGRKVRDLRLRDGDEIAFGICRVIFHSGGAGPKGAVVWKPQTQPAAPSAKPSERSMLADLLIRGLAKEKKPEVLIEKSAKAAMQLTGSDWAALFLKNGKGRLVGRAEARADPSHTPPANLVQLAEWLLESGQPFKSDDLVEALESGSLIRLGRTSPPARLDGMRSVLAVTVTRAEEHLGAMVAACTERRAAFDDECALHLGRMCDEVAARLPPVAELEFWG